MISLDELIKILNDNSINSEDFLPSSICEIYGKKIDDNSLIPLIQEMVLATVDFETPLYDILAYANNFEEKLDLPEDCSFVCDILNIVISNMPVCKENADRLIDLLEDADILDVYNILMQDYKPFMTEKQYKMLEELAKNTFDSGVIV